VCDDVEASIAHSDRLVERELYYWYVLGGAFTTQQSATVTAAT